ncbi:MAG: DNA-binding domain-containing protein [Bacteroidales bacterium]
MKYSLYLNPLSKEESDCFARPTEVRSRKIEDLIKRITGVTSTLSSAETKSIIDSYWSNIAKFIADGEEYHDDYISIRLGISGRFDNIDDRFDRERHKVSVNANVSSRIKEAGSKICLEYEDAVTDYPAIVSVFDWGSHTNNEKITSEGTVEIKGSRLKVDYDDGEQGIFFVNKETGDDIKAGYLRTNQPKCLVFSAPVLEAGTYTIEVRNKTRNGRVLRMNIDATEFMVD